MMMLILIMVMIFDFNNACAVVDDDYHDDGTNEMIKALSGLNVIARYMSLACPNPYPISQPRPQSFSLKKWVGPTQFLRERPWGRGCP